MIKIKAFYISMLILLFITAAVFCQEPSIPFSIEGGEDTTFDQSDLENKISVIFYNPLVKAGKNILVKRALKDYYFMQPEIIRDYFNILPVVDCSKVIWPFSAIVRRELEKASESQGVEVYGDYDGSFRKAFDLDSREIYFIVTNRDAEIEIKVNGIVEEQSRIGELKSTIEKITIETILKEDLRKMHEIISAYKNDGFSYEYITEKFDDTNFDTRKISPIINEIYQSNN